MLSVCSCFPSAHTCDIYIRALRIGLSHNSHRKNKTNYPFPSHSLPQSTFKHTTIQITKFWTKQRIDLTVYRGMAEGRKRGREVFVQRVRWERLWTCKNMFYGYFSTKDHLNRTQDAYVCFFLAGVWRKYSDLTICSSTVPDRKHNVFQINILVFFARLMYSCREIWWMVWVARSAEL